MAKVWVTLGQRAESVTHSYRMAVLRLWAGRVAVCAAVMIHSAAEAQTRPRPRPDLPPATADQAPPKPRPNPAPPENPPPGDLPPNGAPPNGAPPNDAKPRDPTKGAVTNLPIPRFVTLKGAEGNARRGPGLTHRIDWVFTTTGTPLRITAEYENWRRVEDFEGMGGWVHFTLLSGTRSIIVTQDMAEFHVLPDPASPVAFQAEAGALARLISCTPDWCRVKADGEKGWAPKSAFWGVDPDEVIE